MEAYFFDRGTVPWNPMYDDQVAVQRLVTREHAGSERIGLHISKGKPGAHGTGVLYPDLDEVIYVLDGSIGVDCGGGMRFLGPGQGVLIPAGTSYAWAAGADGWTSVVAFSPPKV